MNTEYTRGININNIGIGKTLPDGSVKGDRNKDGKFGLGDLILHKKPKTPMNTPRPYTLYNFDDRRKYYGIAPRPYNVGTQTNSQQHSASNDLRTKDAYGRPAYEPPPRPPTPSDLAKLNPSAAQHLSNEKQKTNTGSFGQQINRLLAEGEQAASTPLNRSPQTHSLSNQARKDVMGGKTLLDNRMLKGSGHTLQTENVRDYDSLPASMKNGYLGFTSKKAYEEATKAARIDDEQAKKQKLAKARAQGNVVTAYKGQQPVNLATERDQWVEPAQPAAKSPKKPRMTHAYGNPYAKLVRARKVGGGGGQII